MFVRLTRFALSVAAYSLLPWLIIALGLFAIGVARDRIATSVLLEASVISGCGILFTVPASVGVRYFESRGRFPQSLRYTLGVLWVLVVSTAWWNVVQFVLRLTGLAETVPVHGLLAQAWVSIPFAGVLFYATYALRKYVALQRTRRRIERWKTFRIRPKAFAIRNYLDVFEIMQSMDALKRAYRISRRHGDRLLKLFQYELSLSSDPRYNLPKRLPIALEILRHKLELRCKGENWAATIHIDPVDSFPAEMVIEPAVLCAAAVFAVEHALHRGRRHINLNITFQKSPIPSIRIRTDVKGRDLSFTLDNQSAARAAKNRLVKALNRLTPRGSVFEVVQDSDGYMAFQISVRNNLTGKNVWKNVEHTLGPSVQLLSLCNLAEGANRVYVEDNVIHKIQLLGHCNPKLLALAEEYNILRRLKGVEGVPRALDYKEYKNFAVLSYNRIDGIPIDQYLAHSNFERKVWFRLIIELSTLLNRIHKRGVLHRDLRPDNILVREDGKVSLIDFDQAVAGVYGAQQVDIRGEPSDGIPPCISVGSLIDQLALRDEHDAVVEELRSAWKIAAQSNASSPGCNIAYYHWVFGDAELSGERDWFGRWGLMYGALRGFLPHARVLDIGCNLGLVAAHCMLYGAKRVTAVDVHEDVLEAGRTLAKAADVNIDFQKGNLSSREFIDFILGREYDLVIALSVLHWLENRDEVLRLLAVAPRVLYEGHNPPSVEINLLQSLGFGNVQLIGYSERLRGLYLALR